MPENIDGGSNIANQCHLTMFIGLQVGPDFFPHVLSTVSPGFDKMMLTKCVRVLSK